MWEEAGTALTTLAGQSGAQLRPRWTGYRVRFGGVRVDYRGGLDGFRTVVRVGGRVVLRRPELSSADEVLQVLSRSTPSG